MPPTCCSRAISGGESHAGGAAAARGANCGAGGGRGFPRAGPGGRTASARLQADPATGAPLLPVIGLRRDGTRCDGSGIHISRAARCGAGSSSWSGSNGLFAPVITAGWESTGLSVHVLRRFLVAPGLAQCLTAHRWSWTALAIFSPALSTSLTPT